VDKINLWYTNYYKLKRLDKKMNVNIDLDELMKGATPSNIGRDVRRLVEVEEL